MYVVIEQFTTDILVEAKHSLNFVRFILKK